MNRNGASVLILFAGCLAFSATSSGAPANHGNRCSQCEPSSKFRHSLGIPLPEHAIIYDFGNGPFWRNSYLLVIDLDHAEARTYRNPPENEAPTGLQLAGKETLSSDGVEALAQMAKLVWYPPRDKRSVQEILSGPTDTFETIFVLNGQTMVEAAERGNGPEWFNQLRDKMIAVARPSEHRIDVPHP